MSIATFDRQEKRPTSLLSDRLYRPSQPDSYRAAPQWITMDEPQPWDVPFGQNGIFQFEEKPDEWLVPLVTKICELGFLPENWDSYGARPIDPRIAGTVIVFLLNELSSSDPRPSIVPTCYGGIQAEWHTGGIDLEIEFESPHAMHLSFDDGEREEELENVDIRTLRDRLEELRLRVTGA